MAIRMVENVRDGQSNLQVHDEASEAGLAR